MTACGGGGGGGTNTLSTTPYVLTVDSANPASGVAIAVSPADNNGAASGSTSFTRAYDTGTSVTLTAPATASGNSFASWAGCATSSTITCNVTLNANTTVTANYTTLAAAASTITVDQSSTGPVVTDKILGMNLAAWYDVVGNATAVNTAFAQAGIQAIRWPGGSWSDEYHWQTPNGSTNPNLPFMCQNNSNGVPNGSTGWGGYSTFGEFVTSIVQGGSYDLALTADYGTNPACNGGGEPSEAAAWVAAALTDGIHSSYAATALDYNRIYLAYPNMPVAKGNPLSPQSTIAPGQTVEGIFVSAFRLTKAQWDARKNLSFTFGFGSPLTHSMIVGGWSLGIEFIFSPNSPVPSIVGQAAANPS